MRCRAARSALRVYDRAHSNLSSHLFTHLPACVLISSAHTASRPTFQSDFLASSHPVPTLFMSSTSCLLRLRAFRWNFVKLWRAVYLRLTLTSGLVLVGALHGVHAAGNMGRVPSNARRCERTACEQRQDAPVVLSPRNKRGPLHDSMTRQGRVLVSLSCSSHLLRYPSAVRGVSLSSVSFRSIALRL
jgi:hypothetical protein